MADDPESNHPEYQSHPEHHEPEEEGGGPVKTFLEHLEDLRWTLIKCCLAYALSFMACLSGAPYIIKFLTWPLDKAERIRTTQDPRVSFVLGTNMIGRQPVSQLGGLGLPTNQNTVLRLAPFLEGTNILLRLEVDLNPPELATKESPVTLSTIGPISGFNIVMQIALYGGVSLAAPFILFFLGQFILPALHVHEKKFLYKAAGIGSGLFFLGCALCYTVFLVICLSTTINFSNWLGFSSDLWRAEEYISFVCWFMIGMGIAFQLPLVLLTLVKIGILDASKLSAFRMYWVVVGLVLAAFITPDGNPINMFLLFLPLHFLYEISFVIAWFWERKERKLAEAASRSPATTD